MNYYEYNYTDKDRVKLYRKKWGLFRVISRFFCLHYWKRNGMYGTDDIFTCCKCGRDYYQNVTFGQPPISYIEDNFNGL